MFLLIFDILILLRFPSSMAQPKWMVGIVDGEGSKLRKSLPIPIILRLGLGFGSGFDGGLTK
jgi:hypothetical protein